MNKIAILVDGGFYRKAAKKIFGNIEGKDRAKELIEYCRLHLNKNDELYRIFYYDCPPISKKMQHPLTKNNVDFSKSPMHRWYDSFIKVMTRQRKVALRLGRLSEETAAFILPPSTVKKLCDGDTSFDCLSEEDFFLDVRQKGVDMKIGVDIASLAYKQQVNKIILIAGDSDFVPASKLARREGIDFVVDPMGNHINPDLYEHIDGLVSKHKKYAQENSKKKKKTTKVKTKQ